MSAIPKPRDVTEILRGVGGSEFPWKDPTLGTLLQQAADEIERLRALCSDLYHDATCAESFCRLCGEAIKEWEANHE